MGNWHPDHFICLLPFNKNYYADDAYKNKTDFDENNNSISKRGLSVSSNESNLSDKIKKKL